MAMKVADRFLAEHPGLLTSDETSPEVIHRVSEALAPLEAYHRFRVHGLERVPETGCLLVANHSCGIISEVLLMLRAWHRHFGDRPVRALSHQAWWQFPAKYAQFPKIGAVFAHPEVARQRLGRGEALLVFPGGEQEACRPFTERYRVTLGGRSGFVNLARDAGVPIVPVVICGSHMSSVILPGGETIARKTPLGKAFGIKSFPLTVGTAVWGTSAIASGVSLALLPLVPFFSAAAIVQALVPLPTRIEMEVLEPIAIREGEANAEVTGRLIAAMQASMDRMAADRATPFG
jgi:1-acyl-sn-glycerol-3-phosphate acyltransferase